MKKFLITLLACAAWTAASAEDEYYFSLQYSLFDISLDGDGIDDDVSPEALGFRIGKTIDEHFSIEGGLMVGIEKDEYGENDDDFEFRSALVISGVARYPVADRVEVFGKLGLVHAQYQDEQENEADIEGLVYGVGASVLVTDAIGVSLEYTLFDDGEYDDTDVDIETDVITLGGMLMF